MQKLQLYVISQNVKDGYNTYDSAVVAAYSPEDAATISPNGTELKESSPTSSYGTWADRPSQVEVRWIRHGFQGGGAWRYRVLIQRRVGR